MDVLCDLEQLLDRMSCPLFSPLELWNIIWNFLFTPYASSALTQYAIFYTQYIYIVCRALIDLKFGISRLHLL